MNLSQFNKQLLVAQGLSSEAAQIVIDHIEELTAKIVRLDEQVDRLTVELAREPVGRWIPIEEQKPPLVAETPETNGFFLLMRNDPKRDAIGQCRIDMWFGSVPIDSTHWARIPPLKKDLLR